MKNRFANEIENFYISSFIDFLHWEQLACIIWKTMGSEQNIENSSTINFINYILHESLVL